MKNVFMVLDTECVGLQDRSVYDIAWQIIDKAGNVYIERQFLVRETLTCENKMRDAFYHAKVYNTYIPMLADANIPLVEWEEIHKIFNADVETYNVNIFTAYNVGFDMSAISHTNGGRGFIQKRNIKILDLWQLACETILSTKAYKYYARKLGFVSDKGNIVTNAEKAFAFTSGNWEFIEDHTALSDVKIESQILLHCLRYKKKMPYNVYNAQPWRIVNA